MRRQDAKHHVLGKMSALAHDEVGDPLVWKPQGLQKAANGSMIDKLNEPDPVPGTSRIAPNDEHHGAGGKRPFSIEFNHEAIMPPRAAV